MEKQREKYLKKAEENFPKIYEQTLKINEKKTLQKGDTYTLDFGNHYVGYFSFSLGYTDMYIDAPVRLKIKFCETKEELEADFSAYKGGLCASWLQEEIVHLDFPILYRLPRRYAMRYVKITVLESPKTLVLSDFTFCAVTSADVRALKTCVIADEALKTIDRISVNTLKNCMQRVFEDGPKRDPRLWIGDLRLEALANYKTFQNNALVRRCLYLFAAATPNESGFLPAYVYENPKFVSGYWHLQDYALLFVVTLCDYLENTGDSAVFEDVYPVAKMQMDAAHKQLDSQGIVQIADGCEAFIDWCEGLEKRTALHGVYLYALQKWVHALKALQNSAYIEYEKRLQAGRLSAKDYLFNGKENAFLNAYDHKQKSVHSIVWMILGGVIDGEEAWEQLQNVLQDAESVKPFTPYMHHYVVEAMHVLGKRVETLAYIKDFWGKMVERGTDTFYEAFVENDPDFSPYGDKMINSACHAWSCTPCWFIREN